MHSIEKDDLIFIRLFPNENFHKKIKEICKKHKIITAVVISGIGQLKNLKLGYFKHKNNYTEEKFEKTFELLSLSGIITKQSNEYDVHFHVVLGDENKNCKGGHLIDANVEVTNEIIMMKSSQKLYRIIEKETGLKGLCLE